MPTSVSLAVFVAEEQWTSGLPILPAFLRDGGGSAKMCKLCNKCILALELKQHEDHVETTASSVQVISQQPR
jgi:hypothetical protein